MHLTRFLVAAHAGHRVDLARGAVHHDRGPAPGTDLVDLLHQRLLGRELDRAGDAQHEVVAGHRLLEDPLAHRDRPAVAVPLANELAGLTRELGVELLLESADAAPVDVGPSEHASGEVAGREDAGRLVVPADPGEVEVLDRLGRDVVDLAGDVDELAVLGEIGRQGCLLVRREPEHRSERSGRAGRIDHEARVGEDRRGRHGDRELVTVAIEDHAALGGQLCLLRALRLAEGDVLVRLGRLEQRDPSDQSEQDERDDPEDGQEPATGPSGAPDRRRGRRARIRRPGATRARLRGAAASQAAASTGRCCTRRLTGGAGAAAATWAAADGPAAATWPQAATRWAGDPLLVGPCGGRRGARGPRCWATARAGRLRCWGTACPGARRRR